MINLLISFNYLSYEKLKANINLLNLLITLLIFVFSPNAPVELRIVGKLQSVPFP